MKKTIYLARSSSDNTDTCTAYFDETAASSMALNWFYHLTKKERANTTVTVERYELDVPEDDDRDADTMLNEALMENENLNPVDVREIDELTKVEFGAGQSRNGDGAVNYMLAETDGVELYAEDPVPDGIDPDDPVAMSKFDNGSYDRLKTEILRQANEKGIDVNDLDFWWD